MGWDRPVSKGGRREEDKGIESWDQRWLHGHATCESHPGPRSCTVPSLGLMLCCHHPEILNNFEQGAPYFYFAPGPTNNVSSFTWDTSNLRGLVEEESPSKRIQEEWPMREGEARGCGIKEALELFQGGNGCRVAEWEEDRGVTLGLPRHRFVVTVVRTFWWSGVLQSLIRLTTQWDLTGPPLTFETLWQESKCRPYPAAHTPFSSHFQLHFSWWGASGICPWTHQPRHPSSPLGLPAINHNQRDPVKHSCGPWEQLWPSGHVIVPSGLEGRQDPGYMWARSPGQTPHPVRRNTAEARPQEIWVSGWGPSLPRAKSSTGGEDVGRWKHLVAEKQGGSHSAEISLWNIKVRVLVGGDGKALRREKYNYWGKGK